MSRPCTIQVAELAVQFFISNDKARVTFYAFLSLADLNT